MRIVGVMLIAATLGCGCATTQKHAATEDTGVVAPVVYTCGMHPQIRMPKTGNCPICAMGLIKSGMAWQGGLSGEKR